MYGKFLEKHRLASGFKTQKSLSEKAGISPATISRIEAEVHRPEPETLKLLAKHLYTTSYSELLRVCGYGDDDDNLLAEKNPVTDTPVARFIRDIELSDEELLQRFRLTLDGRELTEAEAKAVIAYLRVHRMTR